MAIRGSVNGIKVGREELRRAIHVRSRNLALERPGVLGVGVAEAQEHCPNALAASGLARTQRRLGLSLADLVVTTRIRRFILEADSFHLDLAGSFGGIQKASMPEASPSRESERSEQQPAMCPPKGARALRATRLYLSGRVLFRAATEMRPSSRGIMGFLPARVKTRPFRARLPRCRSRDVTACRVHSKGSRPRDLLNGINPPLSSPHLSARRMRCRCHLIVWFAASTAPKSPG